MTDKGLGVVIVKTEEGERAQCACATHAVTQAMILEKTRPFMDAEFGRSGEDSYQPLMDALLWLSAAVTIPIRLGLEKLGHKDKPFILVPLGMLSYLPIHAGCMPRPDGGLHFFFHPHDLAFGYRARNVIQSLRRRAERDSQGAFVVSDPEPLPPDFAPLSMSDFESDVALRYVSGRALVGEQATTSAVMSGLAGATLAHFSCHGFVDKRIDYSGVLVLANGELLTYQHLRDLRRIEARLVVLSACRTASAALRVETIVSLPAAFLGGRRRSRDRHVLARRRNSDAVADDAVLRPVARRRGRAPACSRRRAGVAYVRACGRASSGAAESGFERARRRGAEGGGGGRDALRASVVLGRILPGGGMSLAASVRRGMRRGSRRRCGCLRYSP